MTIAGEICRPPLLPSYPYHENRHNSTFNAMLFAYVSCKKDSGFLKALKSFLKENLCVGIENQFKKPLTVYYGAWYT